MEIKGDTIVFKSTGINYMKEKSGVKLNTVRIVSDEEHNIIQKNINYISHILIKKVDSDMYFKRKLSDISILKAQGVIIYIFSWRV